MRKFRLWLANRIDSISDGFITVSEWISRLAAFVRPAPLVRHDWQTDAIPYPWTGKRENLGDAINNLNP